MRWLLFATVLTLGTAQALTPTPTVTPVSGDAIYLSVNGQGVALDEPFGREPRASLNVILGNDDSETVRNVAVTIHHPAELPLSDIAFPPGQAGCVLSGRLSGREAADRPTVSYSVIDQTRVRVDIDSPADGLGNGVLAVCRFFLPSGFPVGPVPIGLSDAVAADTSGDAVTIRTVDGEIDVVAYPDASSPGGCAVGALSQSASVWLVVAVAAIAALRRSQLRDPRH